MKLYRSLLGGLGAAITACSSTAEPASPVVPLPAPPAPLVVHEAAEAPATPHPTAPAVPDAPPLVHGPILFVTARPAPGRRLWCALFIEGSPTSRPDAERIGYAMEAGGAWELLPIADEPSPYASASVVDAAGQVSETPIIRARRLYASWETDERAPKSFLALELEHCGRGGDGFAGARVTAERLDRTQASPAPSHVASLIARVDSEFDGPARDVRALELPAHELTVVFGNGIWLVRDGHVLMERNFGRPEVLIAAGNQLFFQVSSPSEGWLSPVENFHPLRANGSPRTYCDVHDSTGTPLNVRSGPTTHADVVTALPNGMVVEGLTRQGDWIRIGPNAGGDPIGWAYADGLECNGSL